MDKVNVSLMHMLPLQSIHTIPWMCTCPLPCYQALPCDRTWAETAYTGIFCSTLYMGEEREVPGAALDYF